MLYSFKGQYPQPIPFRIVLSNGRTRTDQSTFTEEEIADAGYAPVEQPPELNEHQTLSWNGEQWVVYTKTQEEIDVETQAKTEIQWNDIRYVRDQRMKEFEWRYIRYEREVRLGLQPTDNLADLDNYMQALADITTQEDPFNITWPTFESFDSY